MTGLRFLALCLIPLSGVSCAARPGIPRPPTGSLQPLEPGLEWTYDFGGRLQTRRITGVERVGRFDCSVVEARTGEDVVRYWMRWDRDGLKLHKMFDGAHTIEFDDPVLLIHRLAAPTATWSFEERHDALTLKVEANYESDDDLTVGDRVLRCARIRHVKKAGGRVALDQTCWYAKDIGLVRMALSVAGDGGMEHLNVQLVSWNFTAD